MQMTDQRPSFRPCGDCTACCDGHIIGNSYGNRFGYHNACVFLVKKICTIYKDRPESCDNYQCAWSQRLLPEWMKPNLSNVLVSVEIDHAQQKQFLRVIEMAPTIDYAVYKEIEDFCNKHDTYYLKVPYESNSRDPRL